MAVAGFRADVARAGAMAEVTEMTDELSRSSPAFHTMWQQNDVSDLSHATKDLQHPTLGKLTFEASSFGVDGRHDLTMLVFMPDSAKTAERIQSQLEM